MRGGGSGGNDCTCGVLSGPARPQGVAQSMAWAEGAGAGAGARAKTTTGGRKAFSAVYVNRFGKHPSGSVIEFEGKGPRRENQRRPAARAQAADRSPGEGARLTAAGGTELSPEVGPRTHSRWKRSPEVGPRTHSRWKRSSFNPPPPVKSPRLPPEQAETKMPSDELLTKTDTNSNTRNVDVFTFSMSANSAATSGTKNTERSGKKNEVFRVIYKMLHENENLRIRLLNTSHKSTVDADITNRMKDSPKALDATPFGWV
ncbi:uncharacterized protein [Hemitrygon akajei]|uniref:uncharacterized protein n=1 Tax=Hemitrygon akajei TaxID=2704970 RepID=UPI003BF942E3